MYSQVWSANVRPVVTTVVVPCVEKLNRPRTHGHEILERATFRTEFSGLGVGGPSINDQNRLVRARNPEDVTQHHSSVFQAAARNPCFHTLTTPLPSQR